MYFNYPRDMFCLCAHLHLTGYPAQLFRCKWPRPLLVYERKGYPVDSTDPYM